MKISPLLLSPLFSLALFLAPARAEEPAPVNLTPEMQALLADLMKAMAQAAAQAAPEAAPVPEPAAPNAPAANPAAAAPRDGKPPLGSMSSLRTSGLTTNGLSTSSLAPAGGLGGRGTNGGTPRLTITEWRQLFPVRDDRR